MAITETLSYLRSGVEYIMLGLLARNCSPSQLILKKPGTSHFLFSTCTLHMLTALVFLLGIWMSKALPLQGHYLPKDVDS